MKNILLKSILPTAFLLLGIYLGNSNFITKENGFTIESLREFFIPQKYIEANKVFDNIVSAKKIKSGSVPQINDFDFEIISKGINISKIHNRLYQKYKNALAEKNILFDKNSEYKLNLKIYSNHEEKPECPYAFTVELQILKDLYLISTNLNTRPPIIINSRIWSLEYFITAEGSKTPDADDSFEGLLCIPLTNLMQSINQIQFSGK